MSCKTYLTTSIAKRLNKKNAYVRRKADLLLQSISRVKYSESWASYLCDDLLCESQTNEYRGQKFIVYKMSEKFLFLLLCGVKGKRAFDFKVELITCRKACKPNKLSLAESAFLLNTALIEQGKPEAIYTRRIMKHWSEIFPTYTDVKQEYVLPDGDKIDMLARDTISGRPVIVEVKPNAISAHKQLRSYAVHFEDPVLVNLTPTSPVRKVSGIDYVSFMPDTTTLRKSLSCSGKA